MLHNPYCSPSTSRAIKKFHVNHILPGLVTTGEYGGKGPPGKPGAPAAVERLPDILVRSPGPGSPKPLPLGKKE
jgi:hypothetical protein